MPPSDASELAKATRIMFRPAPRPARARRAKGSFRRLVHDEPYPAGNMPDEHLSRSPDASLRPPSPRGAHAPTYRSTKAYTTVATVGIWCRSTAPARHLAQPTRRNKPAYCIHRLDLFPFRLSRGANNKSTFLSLSL